MEQRITFPETSLSDIDKIRQERFVDWLENGVHLEHLFEIAKAQYRQKICITNCDESQKEKRGCVKGRGLDMNNCQITHCMHLIKSANKKLNEEFLKHIALHPMVNDKPLFFAGNKKAGIKKSSLILIPRDITLVTTKTTNEIIDNVDAIIDH